MAIGNLIVHVYADNIAQTVENAKVEIIKEHTNGTVFTKEDGRTDILTLPAPDISYSLDPNSAVKPYETYYIRVSKEGLIPTVIQNVEIYPGITSIQNVILSSQNEKEVGENAIVIADNGLYGEFSPKIPEEPFKPEPAIQPFVLPEVRIPEYIIVHDGIPTDTSASNYVVSFPEYIKNVASSEIYSTWPTETIKANVYAIISFTLNRVFTEWYRSKGYAFTITSSPQYDQKFTYGRTIFNTISDVVDQIFREYLKYPNRIQPFLAQYNDGIKVARDGWLSQWGSKDLGDKGFNALQILRNYYGNTISLAVASSIEGLPTSYPGYTMELGDCGEEIQKFQNELNMIRGSYPAIPTIPRPDGKFDEQTKKTVELFQGVFNLPVTGKVDFATWYKISYLFVAVSRMLEGAYP